MNKLYKNRLKARAATTCFEYRLNSEDIGMLLVEVLVQHLVADYLFLLSLS